MAPLWVAYQANLGTLLRTCDAVGACMAVPKTPHYQKALSKGDTLPRRPHMHWARGGAAGWVKNERDRGSRIVAVELADDAIPLPLLEPARERTVVLLGHEHEGVPDEVWDWIDDVVEIPTIGRGSSLNVAVAGSLVLYRLAGMGQRVIVTAQDARWAANPISAPLDRQPSGTGSAESKVAVV